MPYLYTLAEENSRTGVPMMRPLFLEFPDATADKHPLDLDAGNQFMLGASLRIGPAPYTAAADDDQVSLPPVGWYDYWTGAKSASTPPAAVAVRCATAVGVGKWQSVKA